MTKKICWTTTTTTTNDIVRLPLGVCLIRSAQLAAGASQLDYSLGIASETVGSHHLAMSLVIVPPGGAARPHYHLAGETIIHILEGAAETRYGQQLAGAVRNTAGDFLFIPSHMPHQPVNLSASERGIAINARNHPAQQEPLVPIDPAMMLELDLDPRGVVTLAPGVSGPERLSMRRLRLAGGESSSGRPRAPVETGAYVVQGQVALQFGADLQHVAGAVAGDFIFVPLAVRHVWQNKGSTEADLVIASVTAGDVIS